MVRGYVSVQDVRLNVHPLVLLALVGLVDVVGGKPIPRAVEGDVSRSTLRGKSKRAFWSVDDSTSREILKTRV